MRFKHATAPIIASFLLLAPSALCSSTLYVNGMSGSDSNDCKTLSSACKTIGHTISLAAYGDSIMVGRATYTENLTIGISLAIMGSGAGKTIVDGGGVNTVLTISSGANVSLSKLTVRNGYGIAGGGVYNDGALTINKSVITANTAYRDCYSSCQLNSGAIHNSGALTINNSSVRNNTASMRCSNKCYVFGGGIWSSGALVINSSTVSGNSASVSCPPTAACDSAGGGIFNHYGTTTISGSTISGNIADAGGGIGNFGTLTLTNSTLSENSASNWRGNASGGGISNLNGATLRINNSTISGNSAKGKTGSYGGGIDFHDGTATIQNSIVANNISGANCYGTIASNGYNLSSDDTCNFSGPGDLNNTDPQLGPLRLNGGLTKTMALTSGSPAIDAGNPNGCTDSNDNLLKTDQRGKPRPDPEDSGGCDIGAYESQSD